MQFSENLLDQLRKMRRICVLTGAGVSAESGVPTFRDQNGLWAKFRPEELASMEGFLKNPGLVWEWYEHRRAIIQSVKPNPGHYALAAMEKRFPDWTLVTQNVDNLHRLAGCQHLLELHGNILKNLCSRCQREYQDIDGATTAARDSPLENSIPQCPSCGGAIRPGVVWFGEMLPANVLQEAMSKAERCEAFLSIGTSSVVYPAAYLPQLAKKQGALLIEINPMSTELTPLADYFLQGPSGKVLPALVQALWHQELTPDTES